MCKYKNFFLKSKQKRENFRHLINYFVKHALAQIIAIEMAAFNDSAFPILVIVTGFEINGKSASAIPLANLFLSIESAQWNPLKPAPLWD